MLDQPLVAGCQMIGGGRRHIPSAHRTLGIQAFMPAFLMQEMLLQEADGKIYLFPAWPKDWNVHFKLHAPSNTTVEAELKDGKLIKLIVLPEERKKNVEMFLK